MQLSNEIRKISQLQPNHAGAYSTQWAVDREVFTWNRGDSFVTVISGENRYRLPLDRADLNAAKRAVFSHVRAGA